MEREEEFECRRDWEKEQWKLWWKKEIFKTGVGSTKYVEYVNTWIRIECVEGPPARGPCEGPPARVPLRGSPARGRPINPQWICNKYLTQQTLRTNNRLRLIKQALVPWKRKCLHVTDQDIIYSRAPLLQLTYGVWEDEQPPPRSLVATATQLVSLYEWLLASLNIPIVDITEADRLRFITSPVLTLNTIWFITWSLNHDNSYFSRAKR